MLLPALVNWLAPVSPVTIGLTSVTVMSVPTKVILEADTRVIVQRSAHRVIGCLLGALLGLACLAVGGGDFVRWVLLLSNWGLALLANPDGHHGDQLCRNAGDVRVRDEHGPEPRPTAFDQLRL
jgi:hypothetical protein